MKGDYTSAATMPVKLFHNPVIQKGKIVPYHVTMIPTNICNAKCEECFCDNRDQSQQLDYKEITDITDELYSLGTRAISLSGGGEPDCHPFINEIIDYISKKGIDVAMVSNGQKLSRVEDKYLNKLKWVRVSGTSSRPVDLEQLSKDMKRGKDTDWGMSYVLGQENLEYQNIRDAIKYTDESALTHLRIVSDMMNPDVNRIPRAKNNSFSYDNGVFVGTTSKKIIWQERTNNEPGTKNCLVNLLHPIVDAYGNIQPCCGIHFSTTPPKYDFGKETSICNWKDFRKKVENQEPFDGTVCDICQYMDYNRALEMILNKPEHEKFV